LFEGLFNPKINFTPREWDSLVAISYDKDTPAGYMMHSLAKIPSLIRRSKRAHDEGDNATMTDLRYQTRTLYNAFNETLQQLELATTRIPLTDAHASAYPPEILRRIQINTQRVYAFGLTIGILLNSTLRVFEPNNTTLISESTSFSRRTVALAEEALSWRPVGSMSMGLCLVAAWAGTSDAALRSTIEAMIVQFNKPNNMAPRQPPTLPEALEWIPRLCGSV
jgi:hypothetical protein